MALHTNGLGVPPEFRAECQRIVEALDLELPRVAARVVGLTASRSGEGVTTIARALAAFLAEDASSRVLFVDASLDGPTGTGPEGEAPPPGFLSVLRGRCALTDAVRKTARESLDVLPSGRQEVEGPAEVSAEGVEAVFACLRQRYRHVVLDLSAPKLSSLSLRLAHACDGVLLVTGTGGAERRDVRATLDRIEGTGARVLGVVLNAQGPDRHPGR